MWKIKFRFDPTVEDGTVLTRLICTDKDFNKRRVPEGDALAHVAYLAAEGHTSAHQRLIAPD